MNSVYILNSSLIYFKLRFGESSNGRTADSESAGRGSNPRSPANNFEITC